MKELVVTNTIKVGQVMLIHPTQAFLGIDRGIIKVTAIHDRPTANEAVEKAAKDWIEELTCGAESEDEEAQLSREYMEQPWVEYEYRVFHSINPLSESNEPQYLPADVFGSSVTSY